MARWKAVPAITIVGCLAATALAAPMGRVTDLGTLYGFYSYGKAVNDSGQIAGYASYTEGRTDAFPWDSGTIFHVGALGGSDSYGLGINSEGGIVGHSVRSDGLRHAFPWQGGVMTRAASCPVGKCFFEAVACFVGAKCAAASSFCVQSSGPPPRTSAP